MTTPRPDPAPAPSTPSPRDSTTAGESITIVVLVAGREAARIQVHGGANLASGASAVPAVRAPAAIAQPAPGPVQVTTLSEAVAAWGEYMRRRGRREGSVASFRVTIERAAREEGWTCPEHLTFDAVTGFLGRRLDSGAWKGVTYNRNLSAFRSLTRFLVRSRRLETDPLAASDRAAPDGGDGSRAATIEEARALIAEARARDLDDRRCRGNRALYWACLFEAGCRVAEPAMWRWRHLALDTKTPFVTWLPSFDKGRRRRILALHSELAELLREHRAMLERSGPDDPVFPVRPSGPTFRRDRDQAGIVHLDFRSRRFSPHSARKFFSTCLTGQGVPEKMVDFLMRHAGRVEHRYYDPSLEEQADAVARLPRLWPS